MKQLLLNKMILLGFILLLAACKKDPAIQTSYLPGEDPNTVRVESNQVSIKLVALEGFSDPRFNMSFNSAFKTSFRFNGGYVQWDFTDLAPGVNSFGFTCLQEDLNENHSARMKFEIFDGKRSYSVSTRETGKCKYEFWLNVI